MSTDEKKPVSSGDKFEYPGGEIRLDKEGRWYHEGVEITHRLTAELFSQSLKVDERGGYCIEVGVERARVVVEDTPFMVTGVDLVGEGARLRLNDKSEEDLDPRTLRVGAENVLYCEVKSGVFPARFLRPAYYQLMEALEESDDGYAVRLGSRLWPLESAAAITE